MAGPRDWVRVAYECGFRWAVDTGGVTDPVVPPDRDLVVHRLTEKQAQAALGLTPDAWWLAWARGWVAGLEAAAGKESDGA